MADVPATTQPPEPATSMRERMERRFEEIETLAERADRVASLGHEMLTEEHSIEQVEMAALEEIAQRLGTLYDELELQETKDLFTEPTGEKNLLRRDKTEKVPGKLLVALTTVERDGRGERQIFQYGIAITARGNLFTSNQHHLLPKSYREMREMPQATLVEAPEPGSVHFENLVFGGGPLTPELARTMELPAHQLLDIAEQVMVRVVERLEAKHERLQGRQDAARRRTGR